MTVAPEDIAVALGRTTPDDPEYAQWQMWISDALLLISARLIGTETWQIESLDDLDEARLDYVVREAVTAHVLHPDDATQVAVAVDTGGSVSRTYRSGRGRVTITDELWALLIPDDDGSGAFVLDTVGGCSAHLPWCSYSLGANWCSCGVDIAGFPIFESADES